MIEFYNVNVQIDGKYILREVSLRILKGEFVYLIGPSGAGKSTILRLIYFDLFPQAGTVIVDKYSSAKIRRKDIPYIRRKIGVVFQDFKLLTDRTVYENVALALRVTGVKSSEIKRRVMRILTEMGLSQKRNHYPQELSGGEQQRVAIARAVINEPFIVLADEPTGNLDPRTSLEILETLERINKKGTAVLMATHNYDLIRKFKHRTIKINRGMIV